MRDARKSVTRAAPALADGKAESADAGQAGVRTSRVGYAPISRVDMTRREIELCATSESLDAHGTIFDYEASKDAFTRWIGNVREMHERRAVGTRVAARCDDETRRIYVRVRISRGAQDTWEKVLDGTLRGASIGASNVVWRRERRNLGGRTRAVNVAARYDLAELSLVDNPSNPDALGVAIVRDAEPDIALLAPWMKARRRRQPRHAPPRRMAPPASAPPASAPPASRQARRCTTRRGRLSRAAAARSASWRSRRSMLARTLMKRRRASSATRLGRG
ncbi:MAG TPA: hypothetical protein VF808_16240 [Ktedonobacterales bacterium]